MPAELRLLIAAARHGPAGRGPLRLVLEPFNEVVDRRGRLGTYVGGRERRFLGENRAGVGVGVVEPGDDCMPRQVEQNRVPSDEGLNVALRPNHQKLPAMDRERLGPRISNC